MTDNTASPYTVPLPWVDAAIGTTVELRHEKYHATVGEVENIMPDHGEGSSVRVGGMWCFDGNGWSLWVKPEPIAGSFYGMADWGLWPNNALDPLIQVLLEARYPSAEWFDGRGDDPYEATEEEIAATLRAAGYMTEAEWEAKRPRRKLPLLDRDNVSSWPKEFINQANQWEMLYRDFANTYNAYTLAARAYLTSTPKEATQ